MTTKLATFYRHKMHSATDRFIAGTHFSAIYFSSGKNHFWVECAMPHDITIQSSEYYGNIVRVGAIWFVMKITK